jgi:hypothetical protein
MFAAWKSDLNRILRVFTVCSSSILSSISQPQLFQTELAIAACTHSVAVSRELPLPPPLDFLGLDDLATEPRDMFYSRHKYGKRSDLVARSAVRNTFGPTVLRSYSVIVGELPPPPPRACFGRDRLIEKIVNLAESFTPLALIGPGGIGKTSIALAALHHNRIQHRFGHNRCFIHCDQFSASREVIGAEVEDAESLNPLHPFLSPEEMLIVLDDAESMFDPRRPSDQETYDVVEESSKFAKITSHISMVSSDYGALKIPTLSMGDALDAFYPIYQYGGKSDLVNSLLEQVEFHPLSVTLLGTAAHQSQWDGDKLGREWERRQIAVLPTGHNRSLADTIELSLSPPMFKDLGHNALELLDLVAFFPQGIDENNFTLFPGEPDNPSGHRDRGEKGRGDGYHTAEEEPVGPIIKRGNVPLGLVSRPRPSSRCRSPT